ncbi:uncharacterized protein LOC128141346 isoform X2 [Harpia harpyja]|uniref:uncharacterized protein LOC128141346 isoform X2 n=1 Tax=Harpia harpyja TaxID=202280 RepID=UPI0022B0CC15|nr:uncharacterized protein LOC128141346 isoform X2 [Harpia harpyja]
MACGNQSWLSKISQYYIACLPCNSSCSSAGRPEWLRFKLHPDLQLPLRAELTFLNVLSTRGAEFVRKRWSLRNAEAGVRCRGRTLKEGADVSKVPKDPGSEPDPGTSHLRAPRSKMPHFQPWPGKEDLWGHNLRLHYPPLDQFPELDDRLISQLDGPAQEGLWCMEEATWRESWIVGNHNCLKTRRNMNPQIRSCLW